MHSKYNEVGDYAKAIPTNDQWEQQQKKKKGKKKLRDNFNEATYLILRKSIHREAIQLIAKLCSIFLLTHSFTHSPITISDPTIIVIAFIIKG